MGYITFANFDLSAEQLSFQNKPLYENIPITFKVMGYCIRSPKKINISRNVSVCSFLHITLVFREVY